MKILFLILTIAIATGSQLASANGEGFNLGRFPLSVSENPWGGRKNAVIVDRKIGNSAFADFHIAPEDDLRFEIQTGSKYGFSCDADAVEARFFLIDSSDPGSNPMEISSGIAQMQAKREYVVRVQISGLSPCDGYGLYFQAVAQ